MKLVAIFPKKHVMMCIFYTIFTRFISKILIYFFKIAKIIQLLTNFNGKLRNTILKSFGRYWEKFFILKTLFCNIRPRDMKKTNCSLLDKIPILISLLRVAFMFLRIMMTTRGIVKNHCNSFPLFQGTEQKIKKNKQLQYRL